MRLLGSVFDLFQRTFSEGPVRPDGSWRPKGGHELFVHSHQFEPLPALSKKHAKLDKAEDDQLFQLMRELSSMTSDEDVAAHMAAHFRDAGGTKPSTTDSIEVISATLVRRTDKSGKSFDIIVEPT